MLFLQEGFTFRNFLVDTLTIFVFIVAYGLRLQTNQNLPRHFGESRCRRENSDAGISRILTH